MQSRAGFAVILAIAFAFGCLGCGPMRPGPHAVAVPAPFSQYRLAGLDWSSVRRVLVLPLWNESSDPRAGQEVRQVLCGELQSMGLFEVLAAPFEAPPDWSRGVRVSGRFDEVELVELALAYHVDTVLCGAVTHYHAYAPPRIGLSLRLISTAEGIVIASVDGLWDARDQIVAEDARSFYELYITKSQATSSPDIVLGSPRLFQKYVCARVSHVFAGPVSVAPPVVATPVATTTSPSEQVVGPE